MLAREVMTADVITVKPDTPVTEIARLLVARHISAVPVTDAAGRVLGIVSEGDLMRRIETGTEKHRSWWHQLVADNATLSREYLKSHGLKASDIMTSSVATVNEDTPLGAVADLLESKRVKRVPVLRDGKLVGVVSRADLLRAYVKNMAPAAAAGAVDDGKLRGEIMRQLAREPWSPLASVNVVVHDGIAEIYGIAEREDQAKAIAVLAAGVPGVKQVQNHVIISSVPHYAI